MTVYEIFSDGGSSYYATLRQAREARDKFFPPGTTIDKLTLADLPARQLAVRLLNHEQFVEKRETVR
jgi:hypothetical protein